MPAQALLRLVTRWGNTTAGCTRCTVGGNEEGHIGAKMSAPSQKRPFERLIGLYNHAFFISNAKKKGNKTKKNKQKNKKGDGVHSANLNQYRWGCNFTCTPLPLLPKSDPEEEMARSMSPVESTGMPRSSSMAGPGQDASNKSAPSISRLELEFQFHVSL